MDGKIFFLPLLLLLLLVLLLLGFLRLLNNNIKKGLKERLSQIDYFRQLKNFSPCFQRGRGVGRKHTTKQNNERKRETRQGYFIFRLPAHNNRREHYRAFSILLDSLIHLNFDFEYLELWNNYGQFLYAGFLCAR